MKDNKYSINIIVNGEYVASDRLTPSELDKILFIYDLIINKTKGNKNYLNVECFKSYHNLNNEQIKETIKELINDIL